MVVIRGCVVVTRVSCLRREGLDDTSAVMEMQREC